MTGKISSLLDHYLRSDTIYRLHPPAFYELASRVFENDDYHYDFDLLKESYQKLVQSREVILPGTFSDQRGQSGRTVGEFAIKALHPTSQLMRLYRLVRWFKPKNILELGTGLGLSALCLRLAAPEADILSLDGNGQFIDIARRTATSKNLKNIDFAQSVFEDKLLDSGGRKFDFVLLDGDHTQEATIRLVDLLIPLLQPRSLVMLDDIHWSSGMHRAWKEIRQNPVFTSSMETVRWGLLFTDKAMTPVHFNLIPSPFKFWQKYI